MFLLKNLWSLMNIVVKFNYFASLRLEMESQKIVKICALKVFVFF